MAQLKDSIVSGNLRVTDELFTNLLQTGILRIPTSSGGTTYGLGTSGQIIKSNGSSVYWANDSNTNYYHSTGSWSGLTYTATKNGGDSCPALAFTIPTGTTSTTVALGNHTHTTTIAAGTSSDTNQLTLAFGTKYKLTAGGTNFIFTTPSNPNTDRYVNSASFAHDSTNNNVKMTLTRAGSDTNTVTANIPKVSSSTAGVAPKGAAVSSQSQSTKFLREDGSWAAPSYTTNTTYTFASGTNGFTVTPSGGTAQTITVTPSITDNVIGSSLTANNIILGNGNSTIKSSGKTIATSITDVDTTIPTSKAVKTFVEGKGYTTNIGTVTSIKIGTTSYSPSSGVVSLPAYPTNTTYTLGTNGDTLTLTPSSGSIQSVTPPYATTAQLFRNKELTDSTLDTEAGSFCFHGSSSSTGQFPNTDWVGLQVGADDDKFQITSSNGTLAFRYNDSGGTNSTDWNGWYWLSKESVDFESVSSEPDTNQYWITGLSPTSIKFKIHPRMKVLELFFRYSNECFTSRRILVSDLINSATTTTSTAGSNLFLLTVWALGDFNVQHLYLRRQTFVITKNSDNVTFTIAHYCPTSTNISGITSNNVGYKYRYPVIYDFYYGTQVTTNTQFTLNNFKGTPQAQASGNNAAVKNVFNLIGIVGYY